MKILNRYFVLARPKQWLKNIFVFAGLIFAVKFFEINAIIKTIFGFLAFCFTSSGIYVINDICDRDKDKIHPLKKKRPIAAGEISIFSGIIFSTILLFLGFSGGYFLSHSFFYCLFVYFVITAAYSFYFKNLVILDVIIIAAGFVIRAISGTFIINVEISDWLFICSFLLALLLALGKRRNEILILGEQADNHRKNLKNYSTQILDYFILIISSSAIISYSLYCISPRTQEVFHTNALKFTIPFVIYGIFRYIYVLIFKNQGGEPESLLYKDSGLFINFILWSLSIIVIIIFNKI